MEDPPTPTEEEQEQGADRRQAEEAMRGAGHDDSDTAMEDEK